MECMPYACRKLSPCAVVSANGRGYYAFSGLLRKQHAPCAPYTRSSQRKLLRTPQAEKEDQGVTTSDQAGRSSPLEEPIWVRREKEREAAAQSKDIPFAVYLLAAVIVAIAAVGSIFEYLNQNPIFSVVQPDSALYAPILGIFILTGFPTSGWLFYKAVSGANKLADEMDKVDGYE